MTFESAILAGGKNTRYSGRNKAFIPINGQSIIDRNIAVLEKLFPRISIITKHSEQFSDYSAYPMSADYFHEIGPLAGIHSALKNAHADYVFISSCDMPFLDAMLIVQLRKVAISSHAEAVVARHGNKREPLFAFYHRSLINKLEDHIQRDTKRSIRGFLEMIKTEYVDFEPNEQVKKAFTNINRPEDLNRILP